MKRGSGVIVIRPVASTLYHVAVGKVAIGDELTFVSAPVHTLGLDVLAVI
jgi:hypothetical protein